MTTRTRKAPTGPKHDRCIGHVEHAYPKSGMLCVGREIGEPGMVAFADELQASAAAHRAAYLAAPAPDGSHARMIAETVEYNGVNHLCTGEPRCRAGFGEGAFVCLHGARGSAISRTPADAAALAEQVARFRARRGLPVEPAADTYAAAVKVAKARKPRKASYVAQPEPVQVVVADTVVAETRRVELEPIAEPFRGPVSAGHLGYSWTIESGIVEVFQVGESVCRASVTSPIMSDGSRSGREWWPVGERFAPSWRPLTFASIGDAQAARDLDERRMVVAGDHHVTAEPAPEPGQRDDAGEPDSHGTAAAHEFGDYCECGECVTPGTPDPIEPVETYSAPIAAAVAIFAPVLVQPSGRPTCERCGQSFRKSGSGLAWHIANRPDCRPALSVVA